jgi:hypothetical protein
MSLDGCGHPVVVHDAPSNADTVIACYEAVNYGAARRDSGSTWRAASGPRPVCARRWLSSRAELTGGGRLAGVARVGRLSDYPMADTADQLANPSRATPAPAPAMALGATPVCRETRTAATARRVSSAPSASRDGLFSAGAIGRKCTPTTRQTHAAMYSPRPPERAITAAPAAAVPNSTPTMVPYCRMARFTERRTTWPIPPRVYRTDHGDDQTQHRADNQR